jgi:hypothetical protein
MGFGAHAMLWMRFHPSPTSAKGSLRLPGLRILSHKGRGISAALPRVIRNVAESRYGAAGLPLPLWERITGIGRVSGRECMIVANDATVKGGTYFR